MRTYEVAFIAAPTLSAEEVEAFITQVRTLVESRNGVIQKIDNWGKKSLAYRINKFRDGYYVIVTMEADGAIITELERRFRVTDFIIRFLSVRIDEDLKRSAKLKAARQKKDAAARPTPAELPAGRESGASPAEQS